MFNFFKNLGKKKLIALAVFAVLLIALPLILLQVQQQQDLRQRAEGIESLHLEFDPQAKTLKKGESFNASISLQNPLNKDISAVDVIITYDDALLVLNSFEPNVDSSGLTTIINDTNVPGKIHYVGVNSNPDSHIISGFYFGRLSLEGKTQGVGTVRFLDVIVTTIGENEPLAINTADNKEGTFTIGEPTPSPAITSISSSIYSTPPSISPTSEISQIPSPTPSPIAETDAPLNKSNLDVTYIGQLPRYERYEVTYKNGAPILYPGTESRKRKPSLGQPVTFVAHVKNKGTTKPGQFRFRWIMDGVEVKSGVYKGLDTGEEAQELFIWNWQDGNHILKFAIDSDSREILTDALSFRIFVEQTVYNTFNNNKNIIGTYSFEDWIQAHVDLLNQKLAYSNVNERIRIDAIDIVKDNTLPRSAEHAPLDLRWDGRWGFETTEWSESNILSWISRIQPGLIHEWTHQLGIAHSYDANIDASNNLISGKRLIQTDPAISGQQRCCDDVTDAIVNNQPFSEYLLQAINVNKGYRRGYYGDYLFDVPATNVLKIIDAVNNPLGNAQIKVWQSSNHKIFGIPKFIGVTNAKGEYALPNQSLPHGSVTTDTGHTLKPNPFGNIEIGSANNGLLLIETTVNNQKEYAILTIHNFNLAYWRGEKERSEYIIPTTLLDIADSVNIALAKPVSTSSNNNKGVAVVDGDTTSTDLYWEPTNREGKIDDWIMIDLGSINNLYKVNVYSSKSNAHDWYNKFHIEVSSTGAFQGEQKRVATEIDWDLSRKFGQVVSYIFNPVDARYIRVVSDIEQNFVKLAELEVFRAR